MLMRCFRKTRFSTELLVRGHSCHSRSHCWAGVCCFLRNKSTQIGLLSVSAWRGGLIPWQWTTQWKAGCVVCVHHAVRLVDTKLKDKQSKKRRKRVCLYKIIKEKNTWLLVSLCGFKTLHTWWRKTPVWKLDSVPLRWAESGKTSIQSQGIGYTLQIDYLNAVYTCDLE